MKKKALRSWSSGKDSAWTLHVLRQNGEYVIAGLLTTMNAAFDRVAMQPLTMILRWAMNWPVEYG